MSEIINLTKIVLIISNLCNMHFFCKYICAHGLADLLDTSCQQLYPIVNIALSKISNTVMCTLHDFHCSKAMLIHTSTVTGSPFCSEKNYAYASRTACYF